jgi:hypothetical protein
MDLSKQPLLDNKKQICYSEIITIPEIKKEKDNDCSCFECLVWSISILVVLILGIIITILILMNIDKYFAYVSKETF